jgi:hypothetical protein
MKHIFLACTLLTTALSSFAVDNVIESTPKKSNPLDHHTWGVSLQTMSIDEEVAANNYIGDSMQSASLFWQGKKSNVLIGAGLGILLMDDQGSYEVDVMRVGGGNETRKAEAGGINFYFEAGYRHIIEKINFDLLVGFEKISADRSVDNCSNCPEEDIDIQAGMYFKPRIGYQVNDKFWMNLSYSSYLNADISNNVGLIFTFQTN